MTTGLYQLRAAELGLSAQDLSEISMGMLVDMYIERGNDGCDYDVIATQDDFDRFRR